MNPGEPVFASGRARIRAFRRGAAAGCLALWAGAAAAAEVRDPHGVAVVIGNRDYGESGLPDVDYALRDARAFARYARDVLGFAGENVLVLENATERDMRDALGDPDEPAEERLSDLFFTLDPEGRSDLAVFYSGHGAPGLDDEKGYLLPVDAPARDAQRDGYPIAALYDTLAARLGAARRSPRSVRVYLDACFSGLAPGGSLFPGTSALVPVPMLPEGVAEGMTVLSAGGPRELAHWDREARHGVFTRHLLDALYGGADGDGDGAVTAAEALLYLDTSMSAAVWRAVRGKQRARLLPPLAGPGDPGAVLSAAPPGGWTPRPEVGTAPGGGAAGPDPAPPPPPPDEAAEETALGLSFADRAAVQAGLESLVGSVGHADGVFGPRTRAALRRWQEGRGLEPTGYLTRDQADALAAAGRAATAAADRAREERERAERERDAPDPAPPPPPPPPDAAAVERGLELALADRVAVQAGLESLVGSADRADGVFGARTRAALRRWQEDRGVPSTGYLTRDQAEALAAAGRATMARDDAAFAAARSADTAAAFDGYLSSHPSGRHAEDARRLRAAAARDDAAFAAARSADTAAAFDGYLTAFPSGRHTAEARRLRAAAAERIDAGDVFRDCPHCPEMAAIPGGSFAMGSPRSEAYRDDDESPVGRVAIRSPFAVGVHEVTRGEFARFVQATDRAMGEFCLKDEYSSYRNRDWLRPGFAQEDSHPVVCVSWDDAQAYAAWLSAETGEDYRLLSESEWEYAARAGTATARYWGESAAGQCDHANGAADEAYLIRWRHEDCEDGYEETAPVGSFSPNAFGLRDMLGNVSEWVADCRHENYADAPSDGGAWLSARGGDCSKRGHRGGSWRSASWGLRAADRSWSRAGVRFAYTGFRVARTLSP